MKVILGQLATSNAGITGSNAMGISRPGTKGTGFTVKALYDYTAADKDEVGNLVFEGIVDLFSLGMQTAKDVAFIQLGLQR